MNTDTRLLVNIVYIRERGKRERGGGDIYRERGGGGCGTERERERGGGGSLSFSIRKRESPIVDLWLTTS